MIVRAVRLLTCAFASGGDFLDCYSDESVDGLLYCRTRSGLEIGEQVVVEVSLPGLPNRTSMRGEVAATRAGQGSWIQLHVGDAHGRDFLLRFARGELLPGDQVERGHRRIPVAVPVTCRIEEVDEPAGQRVLGTTRDLGGGGAWIESPAPPPVGTRVSVLLGPMSPAVGTLRLDGRVAWLRRDRGARGFGIRFDPKGSRDARRLRALLRRACESGWVGFAGWPGADVASRPRG